ncbi:MAG: QueT transporter family protein [Anaerorhabdus sp.]
MKMKRFTKIAMIAAIYATLTLALAPLSFGVYQIRVAEALTVLPILYPPAILGLTLGCAISNLLGALLGVNVLGFIDVFVGTAATFLAAVCAYKLRHIQWNGVAWLSILMAVIFNAIIIGAELAFVITPQTFLAGWITFGLEVGLGELVACTIFGVPLLYSLKKTTLFED